MKTINQWEAEAKVIRLTPEEIKRKQSGKVFNLMEAANDAVESTLATRILTLIHLIREKDKALKNLRSAAAWVFDHEVLSRYMDGDKREIELKCAILEADKVVALTENLK